MARVLAGPEAIAQGVRTLRAGGVVAFPTETVYGLGTDALNADAVAKVFALKGRPSDNPLIVHVAGEAMARQVVSAWNEDAQRLAERFWPGPLTLVLPKSDALPDAVTAGGTTVGVRAPAHPLTLALLEAFGGPLVGPSANRSGRISPTTPAHVEQAFADVDLPIVDGGACARGIESTVLDLTTDPPRVLRPGVVTPDEIAAVLGRPLGSASRCASGAERSPGRLGPHYRPMAPVVLVYPGESEPTGVRVELPDDADACAVMLYDALHRADAAGPERIVVVLPTTPRGDAAVWDAILERLGRAAQG
ncbi:MAG: L-threonylcarbamoyladenylate synthase [Phycisphaerales bacterium]